MNFFPRGAWELLDCVASPDEAARVLEEIRQAESALRKQRNDMRAEQTQLLDWERRLSERERNINAEWAALRQARIESEAK